MADSGKTGGADQAAVNGMGWRVRMALAAILRLVPFVATMVLMVILWDACGGGSLFSASSSSSATSTGTPTPGSGSFLYVTNFAAGNVIAYHRNPKTGGITSSTNVAAGPINGPVGLGTASNGIPFLYVANSAANAIYQYSINLSTGALTALSTSNITAGNNPQWIALNPEGNFAYSSNFGTLGVPGSGSISLFTVDSTTGELAPNSPSLITASIVNPSGLTVGAFESSPFLYVTDQGADDIVSYLINSTNGSLQTENSVSLGVGGLPGPVILDASNDFVYATDTALGLVYPFQQTATGLALISPGSYSSATPGSNASVGLTSVITSSSNEYLFVANEASNSITEFQVAPGVGTLTLITSYTIGNLDDPTGVAAVTDATSLNSYLYAANQGNGTVSIFSINPDNGALTFLTTVSTGASGNQPMFPLIAF